MKYSRLGSSGLKVSKVCLGTMTWGEQNTQDDANQQLDYAFEQGVNFIDTAELYPVPFDITKNGDTEKIMGDWMKKKNNRADLVIASKIVGPRAFVKEVRETVDFSKTALEDALHKSLTGLQTDYIDLYQLHWPERNTNFFGPLG